MAVQTSGYAIVTIPAGQTSTPEIIVPERHDMVGIASPAVLPENVFIEVSERSEGTFSILQNGGVDIQCFAGKSLAIAQMPYEVFRLRATVAVAADRAFRILMKKRS